MGEEFAVHFRASSRFMAREAAPGAVFEKKVSELWKIGQTVPEPRIAFDPRSEALGPRQARRLTALPGYHQTLRVRLDHPDDQHRF